MGGIRLAWGVAALLLTAASAAGAGLPATDFDARVTAAKAAMMGDPQAALQQSLAALAAARREPSAVHIATAQWLQGEALLRLDRLDDAAPVIDQALATAADRAADTKLHGDLLMARSEIDATRGQVQPALLGFQSAYRIFAKVHEPRSQAMALQNIGSIYQDAGDYGKVLEYYAQSADLYPADLALLITADNNIGNALKSQHKPADAVAEFQKALDIARRMQSPQLEADVLTNLAAAEVQAGRLAAAQQHLDQSLKIAQRDPSARGEEPFIWGVAAQVQLARHEPRAAAQFLARTFQGVDLTTSPPPFRDFHETAYNAFSALGDDRQALAHLRAYKRLDDQARQLAASTTAALMSAQFDFANQKTRIVQLKAGQLQRDVALARSRNLVTSVLLVGASLISALLAVSVLWIRRSRNDVRDANGKLSEANRALEKALRARTEFLAATSHEIRTPLNGILGMTQVILATAKLDAPTREKVAMVHGAGETMRALVDDILDIARIETDGVTLNRGELDLPQLCRETLGLWRDRAEAKGLQIALDADQAPGRIVEDAGRLRQILFNLMSNAIKFTESGRVGLTVEIAPRQSATLGPQLLLTVADTGVGIPADKLDEVFESFRQADSSTGRNYEGTGLGLAICRRLAQAMGGDIDLASTVGEGSRVTVRIPLVLAAMPAEDEIVATPSSLGGCRILVCDTNPLAQAVIKATLQPVTRGVQGVDSCEGAQAATRTGRFDLILADANVLGAERQARLAALRALAAAVAPALVVVLTPEIGENEAGRLLGAGAAQIIKKPIAASALAGALAAGFAARAATPAPEARISAAGSTFV